MIGIDFMGRYPTEPRGGNKYILIMYDYDTNYIKGVPVTSRKAATYLEAFKTLFDELTTKGFKPELVCLDNEASKLLCNHIEAKNVDIQLVTPGNHRNNPAERAIQTYRSYFLSARAGVDLSFSAKNWDLILPQVNIIINLFRLSRINPLILAYNQVHGARNWIVQGTIYHLPPY